MPLSAARLPPSTSPDLHLAHPTPAECEHIWTLVHDSWGDSLNLSQFLAESEYLLTVPLARDGGMTLWVLVDKTLPPDERPILASCETFKKNGLLARAASGVEVQDVVLHGIASVFCVPAFRGRGYPVRMLRELGEVLRTWQIEATETCVGSVLYSDIGKEYYTKLGWKPVGRNSHLALPAKKREGKKSEWENDVLDAHLVELCRKDEELLRKRMECAGKDTLIVVPDVDHMRWHHAKEDFVCGKVLEKECPVKGVLVGDSKRGDQVCAVWTRKFYGDRESARREDTLYILRLIFEQQDDSADEKRKKGMQESLKTVTQAAQDEADRWGLGTVKLWDPSPLVIDLMQGDDAEFQIIEREHEGIASLMWYGDTDMPDWVANEKYAWL